MPAWLGSLRFRLTAFYTLLLAAVIVTLSFGISNLLERELRQDVDARLKSTSNQFVSLIRRTSPDTVSLPSLEAFSSTTSFVQFTDVTGRVARSDNLEQASVTLPTPDISSRASSGKWDDQEVAGLELRLYSVPYTTEDDRFGGVLVVGQSLEPMHRTVRLVKELLLWGSAIGIAGSALGGWLLAGQALRPINRMTATAAEIATGRSTTSSLRARLDEPQAKDEVSRLARTFNAMLDRLEETFTAQRRFLADASHELRTPLTAIRGNAEVLSRQAEDWQDIPERADVVAALDDIERESARMGRLVGDLLQLARSDAPQTSASGAARAVSLDEIAREAVRTAGAMSNGQELRVDAQAAVVRGDRDALQRLLLILLDNALRHTGAGGTIEVRTRDENNGWASVRVRDEGEGIAAENLPHIFDRFYRADTARARATGGTGLGLAIARAIVDDHGGEISVESQLGHGTTFTVRLPRQFDGYRAQ